jgi:mannose-6-phosphate isomerase-like protein (cupin superfamily)
MKKAVLVALGMTALLVPFAMKTSAQQGSKPATYITKAEVDAVNATPGVDRTIRVVDIGNEHYSVGIIHRGATGGAARGAAAGGGAGGGGGRAAGGGAAAGGGGGRAAAGGGGAAGAGGGRGAAVPCGERTSTPPPAGGPSGISHDVQTEGYLIVSGSGTMVTGGHIVNGSKSAPDAEVTTTLNGPSCSGAMVGADVVSRAVNVGDIIIIPAGTPHGWSNIPDHVDYLSFRPSQNALTAGYVNPAIKK